MRRAGLVRVPHISTIDRCGRCSGSRSPLLPVVRVVRVDHGRSCQLWASATLTCMAADIAVTRARSVESRSHAWPCNRPPGGLGRAHHVRSLNHVVAVRVLRWCGESLVPTGTARCNRPAVRRSGHPSRVLLVPTPKPPGSVPAGTPSASWSQMEEPPAIS